MDILSIVVNVLHLLVDVTTVTWMSFGAVQALSIILIKISKRPPRVTSPAVVLLVKMI